MSSAVDALWDCLEEIETTLGLGNPVGETRVSVRAADLRAALHIIDGHLISRPPAEQSSLNMGGE